jgi:hypothetical protein
MVLGIATRGAVLHAFAPAPILQKAILESSEAMAFLSGLQHAYLAGAMLTGIAIITSLVRSREEKRTERESS